MKIIYTYPEAIAALEQFIEDKQVTVEIESPITPSNAYQPSEYVNPNLRKLLQSFGYHIDENHRKIINAARKHLKTCKPDAIMAVFTVSRDMEGIICMTGTNATLFVEAVQAHEFEHIDNKSDDKINYWMKETGIKRNDLIKLITISRCAWAWKCNGGRHRDTIETIISSAKELGYNIDKDIALNIFSASVLTS